MRWSLALVGLLVATRSASAQDAGVPEAPIDPAPLDTSWTPQDVELHGFASEGAFASTSDRNDYLGSASRASLELFEAGLNVSTQATDKLRVGLQLFARDVGTFRDPPHVDWAFADYRWKPWLGLRAGITRMPFGLYNEYTDVDSARVPVLMPQSVYPIRNRDVLLSQTGFLAYGNQPLGRAGELDYQAWLGTLTIPENALEVRGATLDDVTTRYVTGAQLFWSPPVEGLRVGATVLRASIDFSLTLSDANIQALIAAGLVPADYDGQVRISQRPDTLAVASAEYVRGPWLFAAEYSRWWKRQSSSLPVILPTIENVAERYYGMADYRLNDRFELGAYYSVANADAHDRGGHDMTEFAKPYYAFQRDAAATVELDVNDHWLWKVEGHFIDGTADLTASSSPDPVEYWGFFLLRTTVAF